MDKSIPCRMRGKGDATGQIDYYFTLCQNSYPIPTPKKPPLVSFITEYLP